MVSTAVDEVPVPAIMLQSYNGDYSVAMGEIVGCSVHNVETALGDLLGL